MDIRWWQNVYCYQYLPLCLAFTSILKATTANYEMRLDMLRPCHENLNNSARFGPLDVHRLAQNRFRLNGTLIVDRMIIGPLEMRISATRCNEENNNCDEFNTLHFENVCKRITDNNPITYEFMSKITPEFMCPVKPDVYDLSGGILNFSLLNRLPLHGFIWGIHLKFYVTDTKEMVFCTNLDAKFMRFNEGILKRKRH